MSNPCISSQQGRGNRGLQRSGDKLGSIDDVIIDKVSGQVRYAALECGGFLGMGTDCYPIPWSMVKYDTGLDGYVVPLRKEQLEKAPRYQQTSMPEHTDEYGRRSMTTTALLGNSRPKRPSYAADDRRPSGELLTGWTRSLGRRPAAAPRNELLAARTWR